jgi:hypothetical protein
LNEKYAIKKIPWLPRDPSQISEILIQVSLAHPNVVNIIETFTDKEQKLNVVMNFSLCDFEQIVDKKYGFCQRASTVAYSLGRPSLPIRLMLARKRN